MYSYSTPSHKAERQKGGCAAHEVDELLKGDLELDDDRLAQVAHRPHERVVAGPVEQLADQRALLAAPARRICVQHSARELGK